MNTREDIHRELFGRLAAEIRSNPYRPALDTLSIFELEHMAMRLADIQRSCPSRRSALRNTAMTAAVAALRVVYSLDDALS